MADNGRGELLNAIGGPRLHRKTAVAMRAIGTSGWGKPPMVAWKTNTAQGGPMNVFRNGQRSMKEPNNKTRKATRRRLAVPRFERFGEVWAPRPRDNPLRYVWLRLKPEPRLTPHRDD